MGQQCARAFSIKDEENAQAVGFGKELINRLSMSSCDSQCARLCRLATLEAICAVSRPLHTVQVGRICVSVQVYAFIRSPAEIHTRLNNG